LPVLHAVPGLSLNWRDQWPAISGEFVTYSASYDQHVEGVGGLGLMFLNDKAGQGTLSISNISAIYSYQLNVSREFSIRFGFEGTYFQQRIDWDKLTFGDQIDARYGFVYETNEVRPDETSKKLF
jgi:type IX secretion system PorP/SprF family membrane protein